MYRRARHAGPSLFDERSASQHAQWYAASAMIFVTRMRKYAMTISEESCRFHYDSLSPYLFKLTHASPASPPARYAASLSRPPTSRRWPPSFLLTAFATDGQAAFRSPSFHFASAMRAASYQMPVSRCAARVSWFAAQVASRDREDGPSASRPPMRELSSALSTSAAGCRRAPRHDEDDDSLLFMQAIPRLSHEIPRISADEYHYYFCLRSLLHDARDMTRLICSHARIDDYAADISSSRFASARAIYTMTQPMPSHIAFD